MRALNAFTRDCVVTTRVAAKKLGGFFSAGMVDRKSMFVIEDGVSKEEKKAKHLTKMPCLHYGKNRRNDGKKANQ